MALDGIAVAYLVHELQALVGGRIEKIHQPEADEIILTIKSGGSRRLLLTANAQGPRVHLTNLPKDNPMTAPLFCMVLRKHLMGGRVTDISQQEGLERVVNIKTEAVNEMGDRVILTLSIEIMGKHSNIILISPDGTIIDSVKHITNKMSSLREVLPGRAYSKPPEQDKVNPVKALESQAAFYSHIALYSHIKETTGQKWLYNTFMGISPTTAKEIIHRAGVDASLTLEDMTVQDKDRLFEVFSVIIRDVLAGDFKGELVTDNQGNPIDFAPYELTIYGAGRSQANSMSALLDDYYGDRDQHLRVNQKSQDLRRLISQNIERCVKKHDVHERSLADIENREVHRLYGELLTANLYRLSLGMKSAVVENYNDPEGKTIEIPMDVRLSPIDNAQKWYKLYNKEKRRFEALKDQIKQNGQELLYLESVMTALENAVNEADLNEIREELAEQGFAKRRGVKKAGKNNKAKSAVMTFNSADGFLILVGKNNRQNDELTTKTAENTDLWLHAKDIPGSHVIIKAEGKTVPDRTIEQAASLAAFYSKARAGSLVPVDYTMKKYVKKPGGAKPGMVIYTNQRTAFVKPRGEMINN